MKDVAPKRSSSSSASRRDALRALGALAAAGALGAGTRAVRAQAGSGAAAPVPALPPRGELLIRNAYVMTLDPGLGDVPAGDVHVRDGAIVAVGAGLDAPGPVEIIDATRMIALPGFIDTHWHMWNALLRSLSGDRAGHGYFPMRTELGKLYLPEDSYAGVRLAAAEAVASGITTVHGWEHNIVGPAHAEQALRALRESGLRGRFSYGPAAGQPPEQPIDLAHLQALDRDRGAWSAGGMLTLGLAWRGPSTAAGRREFETARGLGIPISIHAGSRPGDAGQLEALARDGFLGPDVQVIHATSATPAGIEALATSGSPVSLSPYTEMRVGYGLPPTLALLEAGVVTGLSVDTTALSGNADMFAIMKVLQNVANATAFSEFALPARRVLELATIEGARSLGIDDRVGSLTPGKRADLMLVSLESLNLGMLTRPDHLLVEAAQPADVDTVVVDGRILKRHGTLTAVDADAVVADAAAAWALLRERAERAPAARRVLPEEPPPRPGEAGNGV